MRYRPDPLAPPPGYVPPKDAEDKNDDITCDVRQSSPISPAIVRKCGHRGVIRVFIGCENEHVGFVDLCDLHRHAMDGGRNWCSRCTQETGRQVPMKIVKVEAHAKPAQ